MLDEARWSMSFCCVREGGRLVVGVVAPDRDGVLSGVSFPLTFGIDLFRLL
jgi:hypothetical protein